MKVNANSVRVGNVLDYQGKLWRVMKTAHTMPGKGGAFVQAELKSLKEGTKLNERFRSTEDLEVARLDQKEMQFLFSDGEELTFMDSESYEQITLQADFLGDQLPFLQDNMQVMVEFYEESPIGVELPEKVVLEITETEAVVKGQTAASSNKPAVLENGIRVMVPPFLSAGEKIVVRTTDITYVERAK